MTNQPFERMMSLQKRLTEELASFLKSLLPTIYDDWWDKGVLNTLTTSQKRRVDQYNITNLKGLDLAALLRVFDQNWYQISNTLNLAFEVRHFLKEMQTIRNRWAHADVEGFSVDDIYRDLDTIKRFASVIDVNKSFIDEIDQEKTALLRKGSSQPNIKDGEPTKGDLINEPEPTEFIAGQIVYLKSNPDSRGAIITILPSKPENRYQVFMNGSVQNFYASQLIAEEKTSEIETVDTLEAFHAHISALQIQYPGLSTLYSLNAARVDFIPYQFRPVLRFIRSDRPRLLIADGVGVGKTIEAGLILRELQARREVNSVLVICPRPLVTERKWQNEMKRFDEQFTQLDGNTLRYCIHEMDLEGEWPSNHQKTIIPYSLFDEALLYGSNPKQRGKRKIGLLDLDPPPRFDLVIVDEAHHIRNKDTFRHKAVSFFCDHAEAVIFLTATPIQLGNEDLYVLLNMLRPDLVLDKESFNHMSAPNPFINQAVTAMRLQNSGWQDSTYEALTAAAKTEWGKAILSNNPTYIRIIGQLKSKEVSQEDRVRMISETEEMHTFAGIINRTRRRDIGNFTVRKPDTVNIPFTQEQQQLHDNLISIQAEIFSQMHGDSNIAFMMTTIRRQAASSLYGLVPLLEDILNRHINEWLVGDDGELVQLDDNSISSIEVKIKQLLESAKNLSTKDPKLEALRKIIVEKQKLKNNKLMLFSSFRHTLAYLYHHLKLDGFRVGLVHGGVKDEERIEHRKRFEKASNESDSLDILLFSEVGTEGLDYQFCDCIVNYDIPWNPMRIEQRIGRIDRNGQKSESIAIYNLVTPGTVDADIYERCLVRIGVFNNSLGASEEILGEITKEIKSIAENYSLSSEERSRKLQQLTDNKIRLVQEQETLEEKQVELFGLNFPEKQMNNDISEASSFWLSPKALQILANQYLKQLCGKDYEFILGDKALKTLRLSQPDRELLLKDFQKLKRQKNKPYRDWENWLKGFDQHLSITFESECAIENKDAAFIMPLHPLIKQAASLYDSQRKVNVYLKIISNDLESGEYGFALYQWRYSGIKDDLKLIPVSSNKKLSLQLESLLENASKLDGEPSGTYDSSYWDNLDSHHYVSWSQARSSHKAMVAELVNYRKQSLSTSHKARMRLLTDQLKQSNDKKIQLMKRSQITNAEVDYARRLKELEIAQDKSDIVASPVAYGVIKIINN